VSTKKHVVLVLEYDLGDYSEMEEERGEIPTTPGFWEESFYQGDCILGDLEIKAVRIEERKS